MKQYFYSYQTINRFGHMIERHQYRLRCIPPDTHCQRRMRQAFYLYPGGCTTHTTDVWGNPVQYGLCPDAHDRFVTVSSGVMATWPYALPEQAPWALYLCPTPLTDLHSCQLAGIAEEQTAAAPTADALERAYQLTELVATHMTYMPGSTTPATTAAQAAAMAQGVCQDYAHILVGLCHRQGVPARYVCGFVEGTGQTHAWVEVWHDGVWYGLDPTHNCRITYGYVKLAHGRDANDCPVNRGVFAGCTTQQTEIRVILEEI